MHHLIEIFDPQNRALAFGLRPFFRVDAYSQSGRLIATHYVHLDDVPWC